MITKIFTIYDSKAGSYLPPLYMQSTGTAIRAFEDECNNEQSQFNKHPTDFTLFEIGKFDDQTCEMIMLDVKVSLMTALEAKTQMEMNLSNQQVNIEKMAELNKKATMESVK